MGRRPAPAESVTLNSLLERFRATRHTGGVMLWFAEGEPVRVDIPGKSVQVPLRPEPPAWERGR